MDKPRILEIQNCSPIDKTPLVNRIQNSSYLKINQLASNKDTIITMTNDDVMRA